MVGTSPTETACLPTQEPVTYQEHLSILPWVASPAYSSHRGEQEGPRRKRRKGEPRHVPREEAMALLMRAYAAADRFSRRSSAFTLASSWIRSCSAAASLARAACSACTTASRRAAVSASSLRTSSRSCARVRSPCHPHDAFVMRRLQGLSRQYSKVSEGPLYCMWHSPSVSRTRVRL